ncbi:MAG: hypothetical protein NTZ60_02985 [Campylobacterales bacterium]|nr:hypothetical protein [Campylobacterales bacterium]
MKIFFSILLVSFTLYANEISSSDVFSEVMLVENKVEFLLDYYKIEHQNKSEDEKVTYKTTQLKPRNVWQKTYEILVKINVLREKFGFPIIEPIGMTPVENVNPNLVYEQTQRILTELDIFMVQNAIKQPVLKKQVFKDKVPLDVFNRLCKISFMLDQVTQSKTMPSFSFGETMRIYDDITLILNNLGIEDKTIPQKKNENDTPLESLSSGLKILEKIQQLKILSGMNSVDFSEFKKNEASPSDVFEVTQMILAELQGIKARLGINAVTPAALHYKDKTPAETNQLMSWNLRKINLIQSLSKGK